MDVLQIKGLTAMTHIGIYDWEQRIRQNLSLDITIPYDFRLCQDDLAKTIDYEQLCKQVTTFIESHSFKLIETVAEAVAELIKQEFHLNQVSVQVNKPQAIKNAKDVLVSITR